MRRFLVSASEHVTGLAAEPGRHSFSLLRLLLPEFMMPNRMGRVFRYWN